MAEQTVHTPAVEIPAYVDLKPLMRKAGLFSCSEVGFNIALDPLARQRMQLREWLGGLAAYAQYWEVPPLLRNDWVTGEWDSPPRSLWLSEQPGGHLLTPRPLMHLLNRLRWHPVERGEWLLGGWCFRGEDPGETLPLLRQRSFYMLEYACAGGAGTLSDWLGRLLPQLWRMLLRLDLPVSFSPAGEGQPAGGTVHLLLPDHQPLALVRGALLPHKTSSAYLKQSQGAAAIGIGVERMQLALAARYGAEVEDWPDLPAW